MASHGQAETDRLKANLEEQLQRLLTQLQDLEELREELDDEEYEEVKADTMEQMEEMNEQLKHVTSGNMSLVTELGSIKLAIEAAIKSAFKTPDVIRLFARKEPDALRAKLAQLREDRKLGRLAEPAFRAQTVEVIVALKKLGEELTADEEAFLKASDDAMSQFRAATETIGASVISMAGAKAARAAAGGGDDA